MSDKIQDRLLNLAAKNQLAPFYLILSNRTEDLEKWMKDTLAQMLAQWLKVSYEKAQSKIELGVADILWINRRDLTKDYSVTENDLGEMVQFVQWRSIELPWRIVVVNDAHMISERYYNKLLKILEEPGEKISLFLLYGDEKKLLPTVMSRAICLRPLLRDDWRGSQTTQELISKLQADFGIEVQNGEIIGVSAAWDKIKSKKPLQAKLWSNLVDIALGQEQLYSGHDFLQLSRILELSTEEEIYHNSFQNRLHRLLHATLLPCALPIDGNMEN